MSFKKFERLVNKSKPVKLYIEGELVTGLDLEFLQMLNRDELKRIYEQIEWIRPA